MGQSKPNQSDPSDEKENIGSGFLSFNKGRDFYQKVPDASEQKEDISFKAWADSNANHSVSVSDLLDRLEGILASHTYRQSGKKHAIEKLLSLIRDKHITVEIPTSDLHKIGDRLVKAVQEYTSLSFVESKDGCRMIPPTLNALKATTDFSVLIQKMHLAEFKSYGLNPGPFRITLAEQIIPHTAGFMEKTDTLMDPYIDQYPDSRPLDEKRNFINAIKANEDYTEIHLAYANALRALAGADSLKRGEGGEITTIWTYEEITLIDDAYDRVTPENGYFSELNHSRILDRQATRWIQKKAGNKPFFGETAGQWELYPMFIPAARWVDWPGSPQQEKKLLDNGYIVGCQWKYCSLEMMLTEQEILSTFISNYRILNQWNIEGRPGKEQHILEALPFTGTGLKFYNTLDTYSRHPEWLRDLNHRVVFMMGIFGGGARDATLLTVPRNQKVFEKFIRDSVLLYAAEQNTEHGIFLLEILVRLRKTCPDFEGSYVNERLRRTLEDAVFSGTNDPYQSKKILCTQLLQAVLTCRAAQDDIDPEKAIELIKLNSRQNGMYYIGADYGLFADAESEYLNLLLDFPASIINDIRFKKSLISFLFLGLSPESVEKMAKDVNCSDFPIIRLLDKSGNSRVFNATSGMLSHPTLSAFDPIALLTVPPDFYESNNFSADTEKFLRRLCEGRMNESPVSLFYLPQNPNEPDMANELNVETDQRSFFTQRKCLFLKEENEFFSKTTLEDAQEEINYYRNACIKRLEASIQQNGENSTDREELNRLWKLTGILKKLNHIRFDNPTHSVWISEKGEFIVLNEALQTVCRSKHPQKQQYGKTPLLELNVFVWDPNGTEWRVLPEQDKKYDKTAAAIFSNFSSMEQRHCISKDGYCVDMPAYGMRFEKKDGLFHFSGMEDFIVMEASHDFPGAILLKNRQDNNLFVLMSDTPPGAIFLESEPRPDDIGYRAGYYFFPLDKNMPVPKTAQDKLFLTWYFLTQKKTQMAFGMIRSLRKKETVDSSPASIRLLYKIITAPPGASVQDELAIKMQAMLLVAELRVSRAFPPTIPASWSFKDRRILEEKIFPWVEQFPAQMEEVLSLYKSSLEEGTIPQACRLSPEECRILGMYEEMKSEAVPPLSHVAQFSAGIKTATDILEICHRIQLIPNVLFEPVEFPDLIMAWMRNEPTYIATLLGINPDNPLIKDINQAVESVIFAKLNAMNGESAYTVTPENRILAAYEYFFEKRLRPDQVAAVKYILTPNNESACLQFIPGGGKTSVFTPIAVVSQANGEDLSMAFVPHALLASNERYINQKTGGAFSSRAHTIFFDRNSPADPVHLQQIFDTLEHVRKTRGYLILSRETFQSLELRFVELLEKNVDQAAADILGNILACFRTHGVPLIDEVDTVLDIRKEFNYSGGRLQSINPVLIKDTLAIFKILHPLPVPYIHADIVERLLDCPLMSDFYKGSVSRADLKNYFLGGTKIPDGFSDLEKDRLALIKHQAEILLPATARHDLNVSYGFSKEDSEECTVGPYLCNNVPAKNACFSSPYETLNLSIQAHLSLPIHPQLFKKMFSSFWQRHLRSCLIDNPPDQTDAEKEFEALTGFSLKQFKQILKTGGEADSLKAIPADKLTNIKYYLLEHFVAPRITFSEYVMHADAISFVNQFRKGTGVTGTVENWRSFNGRMHLESSPKLYRDIEGEILGLLNNNEEKKCNSVTRHTAEKITSEDIKSTLRLIRKHLHTRAVIDAGALFAGMTNYEVAVFIAADIADNNNPLGIQYVLYYDADNVLCALSVAHPSKIIKLRHTDSAYIDATLNCKPEKRFTYYDQAHTTGSDIDQMPDAHAWLTVGRNTSRRDLVQAIMRMRGIKDAQTLSILVSDAAPLAQADLMSVLALCEENEAKKLSEDCIRSLFRQIAGATRNRIMDILTREVAGIKDPDRRQAIREKVFSICKRHFLTAAPSPFEMFGHPHQEMTLEQALTAAMTKELELFKNELAQLTGLAIGSWNPQVECDLLQKELIKVINARLSPAQKEQRVKRSHAETGEQAEVQNQVQTTLEVKKEVELDIQVKYTYTDFEKDGKAVKPVIPFLNWHDGRLQEEKCLHTLQDLDPLFGSHIFVTNNYGYFAANEWDASCELRYQRQHIYCLYRMEGDALSCTLLSAEEASAYLNGPAKEKWGSRDRDIHIWLESPSGNLVLSPAISKPAAIEENRHYWDIRTQIQFFRGDIDLLLENPHIEWVQNLHTVDRDAFLDRILDNPIFLKKKQFAIDNREKFLKHCDRASQVLVKEISVDEEKYVGPPSAVEEKRETSPPPMLDLPCAEVEDVLPATEFECFIGGCIEMNVYRQHIKIDAFKEVMQAYSEQFQQIETIENEKLRDKYKEVLKKQIRHTEIYFTKIQHVAHSERPADEKEKQILAESDSFLRDTAANIPRTAFWQKCQTAAICLVVVLIGAAVGFATGGPAGTILGMVIAAKLSGVLMGAAAGMLLSVGLFKAINRNNFLAGKDYSEQVNIEAELKIAAHHFAGKS